ncbi:hypothetical protein ABPG72_007661 [Tetrahymena utriculariae]
MQNSTFYGAFSVGQSQRSKWYINQNKDVPSPIYNINLKNKPSSPRIKIGKGDRSSIIDQRKMPGPGQYEDLTAKENYKKGVKVLGKNYIEPSYDNVSPTKYSPRTRVVYKTQPSFSFTFRQGEVWAKDTPGPNHYFQNDVSFEKKARSTSQINGNSMSELDQYQGNISKNHRKSVDINSVNNKGFTTTEKLQFHDKKTPGVGLYQIENPEIRVKTPAYIFGKSKRSCSYAETSTSQQKSESIWDQPSQHVSQAYRYSIGKSERVSLAFSVNNNNPGPGQYEPKAIQKNIGISIGPTSSQAYDEREYDEKNREERKRKERIDEILKQRRIPLPGPQQYQEVYALDKKMLELRMKTPQNMEYNEIKRAYLHLNDNPGPGDYQQNYQVVKRQSPSFHIQERPQTQRREIEENPGPGEYEHNDTFSKSQGPFFKIGRGQRSNPVRNKYKVGPGSYLINKEEKGNSYTIGNQERFKFKSKKQPGPGQYNISGEIGKLPVYMLKRQQKKNDSLNKTFNFNNYSETQSMIQESRMNKSAAKTQKSLPQSETQSIHKSQPQSPERSNQIFEIITNQQDNN